MSLLRDCYTLVSTVLIGCFEERLGVAPMRLSVPVSSYVLVALAANYNSLMNECVQMRPASDNLRPTVISVILHNMEHISSQAPPRAGAL